MGIGFCGGMLRQPAVERSSSGSVCADVCEWLGLSGEFQLGLQAQHTPLISWDDLALLIGGQVSADARLTAGSDLHEALRRHHHETGTLPVQHLHGSFTLVLMDARAGKVVLYRNLAGNSFTYYTLTPDGLRFASNLAELVASFPANPCPNWEVLPTYFLYRFVPGRETLFKDIYRLLPGELITYDGHELRRVQKQTFADLRGDPVVGHDAVDAVEEVMGRVLKDVSDRDPHPANLLSGGVDSSFIQAMWKRVCRTQPSVSFAVEVDHPQTWKDAEYAVTAAKALGVRHSRIPADEPFLNYLIETIAGTGEPPNHAFTVYFGHLARAMMERGYPTGLCGEGADSLFGTGWSDYIYKARLLRRLLPWATARRALGTLAPGGFGERVRGHVRLAERLDDLDFLEHPVNQVAVFTDWPALEACFGRDAVAAGAAYRRTLLAIYRVPCDPLEQVHACGFLGEAVDSASLWTTLFNRAGGDLVCPFLDSRVIRLALNIEPRQRYRYRRPKDLLKRALVRHMPSELVYRSKLGFGQPIFDWLAPGGQLRPWVDAIDDYDFVDRKTLAAARLRPNWFLYSLLCFDIWHKLFITRSLSPVGQAFEPDESARENVSSVS
jgi:asparagine synthase (glutamine-hydrolysing)